MISTMQDAIVKIDKAGRLVIPSEIRQALRLTPDTPLQIRIVNGVLEIEPRSEPALFKKKGRLTVASIHGKSQSLSHEITENTRREIYAGRAEQLIVQSRRKK